MLSDREREEITEELKRHAAPRGACVDALRIVQNHRGFVPDEALHALAELLGMSVAELDGVATFYNQIFRRPVGRHVLHLCDGVMCWMQGAPALYAHLREHHGIAAGETTPDGSLTLLPAPCLGQCHRAPALLLDGEPHGDITPQRLDTLLAHCHGRG